MDGFKGAEDVLEHDLVAIAVNGLADHAVLRVHGDEVACVEDFNLPGNAENEVFRVSSLLRMLKLISAYTG